MTSQIVTMMIVASSSINLAPLPITSVKHIDIQSKANQPLNTIFHAKSYANNHLGSLPQGKQKLAGISFLVGKKLMQLQSEIIRDKPDKIEGVSINFTCTHLHFLHASSHQVEIGTKIGEYVIRYQDKTTQTIPLRYGNELEDWWAFKRDKGITNGKIAWEGTNKPAKKNGKCLRLYTMTWKNPHPKKIIHSIDLKSSVTRSGPFCVAITAENQ